MKPKVVLDINLFVAAFWNRGSASARIIDACLRAELIPIYTDEVLRGLSAILRDIKAPASYRENVVDPLFARGIRVEARSAPVKSEDPEDQIFLDCAVGGEVDYLITSDKHLLRLGQVNDIVILTPSQYIRGSYTM